MRIRLPGEDLTKLFFAQSSTAVAEHLGVSVRTVNDWKRGKYTIPENHFLAIVELAEQVPTAFAPTRLNNWWQNSGAGKKGAKVRFEKYGSLGTPEGRRLGGINSYANRRLRQDSIFYSKSIKHPRPSEKLAEFIGIMIGDGNITNYQATIYLSSLVDCEYADFVEELIIELFGVAPKRSIKVRSNCIVIRVSSIKLVELLLSLGLPRGDKIRQRLDIPSWVKADVSYSLACIRGIFDTDGCVFEETHRIKGKVYSYPRWSLVSASSDLRESVSSILIEQEFAARIRGNRSVNLERLTDVQTYFRVVGSSNPKHLARWQRFGGVG